jgi:hypothetical protein
VGRRGRFNHEIDVLQALVVDADPNAGLRSRLVVSAQRALLHQPVKAGCDRRKAAFQRHVRYVDKGHCQPGSGAHLRDTATHLPGTDDADMRDVHD